MQWKSLFSLARKADMKPALESLSLLGGVLVLSLSGKADGQRERWEALHSSHSWSGLVTSTLLEQSNYLPLLHLPRAFVPCG